MEANENRSIDQKMNLPENVSNESEEKQEQGKKGLLGAAKSFGSWAARAAGSVKNAAVKAIDRNGDGKLNKDDIAEFKARMDEKKEKSRIEREQNRLEREKDELNPIFEETVTSPEFNVPKLVRLAEIDKSHIESEICRNSIGFRKENEGVQVLTIYPKKVGMFGLTFYPNQENGIYYQNPFDRDFYIAMEDYFYYLRMKKVSELQMIAQALGAKHFKVTFVDQSAQDTMNRLDIKAGVKAPMVNGSGEGSRETLSKEFSKVTVAAEMDFLGHEPINPRLVYLKGDPNIENMIQLRLSNNAPIHQKVSVSLISASGVKEADAIKIGTALKKMGFSANCNFQQEAQTEARTTMEYEIDY